MKIEICEQMVQSWLLNIQQCQVVQTNWTISPLRNIVPSDIDEAYDFVKKVEDVLNGGTLDSETIAALQASIDEDFESSSVEDEVDETSTTEDTSAKKSKKLNIVKKSKAGQFIRQCEIDVVGVRLDNGIVDRVFLVDSAFHKGGLGYHDVVATVIKKLIRAVLVSGIIFGTDVDVTVAFAAPECRKTPKEQIEKAVAALKSTLFGKFSKVSVELYFNETFNKEIFKPLYANTSKLNNDNDLFMRALNLIDSTKKYDDAKSSSSVATAPTKAPATKSGSSAPTSKTGTQPIIFNPSDIDIFRNELINKKRAEITWIYNDGTRKLKLWKAEGITPTTNIKKNIQSRLEWRKKDDDGLLEVHVRVL